MPTPESPASSLSQLSSDLEQAVATAARSTVLVDARRRLPASGIVWSADGVIVAASHTIEREDQITVGLPDGKEIAATLAGRDAGSDIAVLRADASGLEPAARADSEGAAVGRLALAVARPSHEGPMASLGVISALGGAWRTRGGSQVDAYLRTDATLYPGFSGGPLVDCEGRALGMNTSRYARDDAFAVPLAAAEPIIAALMAHGRLRRAFLGAASQSAQLPEALAGKLDGQAQALLVLSVEDESAAGRAGLIIGDLLVRVEGARIESTDDLQAQLGPDRIDKPTELTVLRGGELVTLSATLSERAGA